MSEPTICVSLSQKINLGNFESADAFISVTVPAGSTEAEITAALDTGQLSWKLMAPRLRN